jgi:hypothetical protein
MFRRILGILLIILDMGTGGPSHRTESLASRSQVP